MANECNTLSGESLQIKVKEESVSGVDESTGFFSIARNSYKFDENISEIESPTIKEGRDQAEMSFGSQEVSGDIEVPFDSTAIHLFLKAVFGKYSSTLLGSKTVHSYEVTDNCLSTLQFEDTLKDSGSTFKTLGVKVNTFGLELGEEGQINASFGLMGDYRYMNKILVDSIDTFVDLDAAINSKTIDVDTTVGFEAGDTVVISSFPTTLSADCVNSRTVELVDVTGLSKNDFVVINGTEAQIQTVSVDTTSVYLNRKVSALTGSDLQLLNKEYVIESVDESTTTITLVTGITKAVSVGDKVYRKVSDSTFITKEFFDNKKLEITDTDGNITDADIESMSFNFDNQIERLKTISKNKKAEGKTKAEVTLSLILNKTNEIILENAKNGYKFDLSIKMESDIGNKFVLDLYDCKVVPGSADRGEPGIVKVEIKAYPTKNNSGDYIKAYLTNDQATY